MELFDVKSVWETEGKVTKIGKKNAPKFMTSLESNGIDHKYLTTDFERLDTQPIELYDIPISTK